MKIIERTRKRKQYRSGFAQIPFGHQSPQLKKSCQFSFVGWRACTRIWCSYPLVEANVSWLFASTSSLPLLISFANLLEVYVQIVSALLNPCSSYRLFAEQWTFSPLVPCCLSVFSISKELVYNFVISPICLKHYLLTKPS